MKHILWLLSLCSFSLWADATGTTTGTLIPIGQLAPIAAGTVLGNSTGSTAAPGAMPTPWYFTPLPITTTSIQSTINAACANGGGTVFVSSGTYTAASGAITAALTPCATASVWLSGTGYGYGGTGAGTYAYGTHFVGNGTFDFFDYNNVDCGGGTCTAPTNAGTFIAGMLGGAGLMNMTIDGFTYGVKCGALFSAGCVGGYFANLNIINSTQWGFWQENFWGETVFENIRATANAAGQMSFCSSGGSANQNGNSFARNLFSESTAALSSRGIYVCARGNSTGGGYLNQFLVDGVISIQESHTAITGAATVLSTTAAVTPTDGSATIAFASDPLKGNQPIIFTSSIGTGAGTSVTAGVTYYVSAEFSSNFQVAATVGGSAIVFNCSGACASSTITSPVVYVPNYASFPVDAEVAVTGTVTNSNFLTGQTYYAVYSAQSSGSNGFVGLSNYPGGNLITPATGGSTVSGLNIKNWGPSPIQVWGYGTGTAGASAILPSAFNHLDLEVNGGTANASENIVSVRDSEFTPGGYIAPGSTATYVLRSNNNVHVHPIANATQTFDILKDFAQPFVEGSRSTIYPTNSNNATGGGTSQLNPNFCASFPRVGCGSFMNYLSALAGPDIYYNAVADDIEFGNFAIGASTTQIAGTTTISPGSWTSNVLYTGTGGDTWTLPIIAANGEGETHDITNPSAGTLTLGSQSSQVFNGTAAVTYSIPANTTIRLFSTNNAGTLGWSVIGGPPSAAVTQLIAGTNITLSPTNGLGAVTINATSTVGTAFSALTGSTNTTAAMVVGTGASLTTSGTGSINATTTGGVAFGTAATVNTGTSGATVPLLNGTNTWSASQTFSAATTGVRFWVTGALSGTNGQIYGPTSTSLGISANGTSQALFASAGTTLSNATINLSGITSSSSPQTGTVCLGTGGALTYDTTTTCLVSDGRHKMNIDPLTGALAEIMRLKPVSYDLKPDANPTHLGRQVGLIAQDVMKVDSRLASVYQSGPDEGTPSGVRYEQMVALLVKGMQEQQHEIDQLKRQLKKRSH